MIDLQQLRIVIWLSESQLKRMLEALVMVANRQGLTNSSLAICETKL